MDYSKHNNEKKRKKIRSNAAKSRKKVSFNIFRFTVLAILLIIVVGAAAAIGGFKGVIDSAPDISASDVMPSKLKSVMYYPDGQEAVELVGAQSNRTIARSRIFRTVFRMPLLLLRITVFMSTTVLILRVLSVPFLLVSHTAAISPKVPVPSPSS